MHRLTKLLAVIAISGLVSACAMVKVAPEKLQSIKTVAVVSDLDEELHQYFYGFTIFDTEHETASITAWKINEFSVSRITDLLGKQYRVVSGGKIDRSQYTINKWTDNAAAIAEKSYSTIADKNPEADAYLMVIPDRKVSIVASFSWPVDNIGLLRASLAMRMPWAKYSQYGAYAAYTIYLVDARDGKMIAFRSGELEKDPNASQHVLPFSYIRTSDAWPKSLPAVLQANAAEVETHVKDVLGRSLDQTIQAVGLLAKP